MYNVKIETLLGLILLFVCFFLLAAESKNLDKMVTLITNEQGQLNQSSTSSTQAEAPPKTQTCSQPFMTTSPSPTKAVKAVIIGSLLFGIFGGAGVALNGIGNSIFSLRLTSSITKEKKFNLHALDLAKPILIKTEKASIANTMLHWLLEVGLLHKWDWLKLKPSGNLLVIRAFMVTASVSSLVLTPFFYLANNNGWVIVESDFILPIFTAFFATYWKIAEKFHSSWEHCIDLFRADPSNDDKKRLGLAEDLIVLDLWNHRNFSDFFRQTLFEAIKSSYSNEPELYRQATEEMSKGYLVESTALALLRTLNKSIKSSKKKSA